MAGSDSQRQLLTLIRDFTAEKSQGERIIVSQKKRIEELRSELYAANVELEEAKRGREFAEQELKGCEVELSMNEASIQALEERIALTNNEISKLRSELAALKSEENFSRDGFIEKMLELNAEIRKFQKLSTSTSSANNCSETTSNHSSICMDELDAKNSRMVLENKIAQMILRANEEEEQYKAKQVIHDQAQLEVNNLEKKLSLLESVIKERMALQELSRLTAEMEEKCAALGDELRKRFLCPRCHHDNSEELSEILQIHHGI